MSEYKLINENVKTINSLTVDKYYNVIDINNGLTSFYNDNNELVSLPNTWFEWVTNEKPKGGRHRTLEQQINDKELYGDLTDGEITIRNATIIKNLIDSGKDIKCVIPVSGGKDSQACLKLAVDKFGKDSVLGMFCDTQFEHPLTYQHIENMKSIYGVTIITLCDGNVYGKILKTGRFPSDIARFCTDQLKIQVGKRFYDEYSKAKGFSKDTGLAFEVWYGMRLGESFQRHERYKDKSVDTLYPPHEIMVNKYPKYLEKQGVMFKLPIVDWEEEVVYDFLGDEINPIYEKGFSRCGCFPCLASGDKYKEEAFSLDDVGEQRRIEVLDIGKVIGKNIFTTKGGILRNPDADPFNELDVEYNPNNDEMSPCFQCNI